MLAQERLSKIAEIIPKWEHAEDITLRTIAFSDAGTRAEYLAPASRGEKAHLLCDSQRLHWLVEELREELHLIGKTDYLQIHRSEHRPVYLVDCRRYERQRCEKCQCEVPRSA